MFPFLFFDIFLCLCVNVLCLLLSVYSVFIIEEIKLFFNVQHLSNYHYFIIIIILFTFLFVCYLNYDVCFYSASFSIFYLCVYISLLFYLNVLLLPMLHILLSLC